MQKKETNILQCYIGVNIKHLRSKYNISQEVLANKMNISRQQLVNYETKDVTIPLKQLDKLKQIFDITIDELIYTDLSQSIEKKRKTNDFISGHDLSILTKKYYTQHVKDVKSYMIYTESHIKHLCSNLLNEIKEKIFVINTISDIANSLKINLDEYYSHRFDYINEKEYLKRVLQDTGIDSVEFDNYKIKWIVKLLSLKDSLNHISYVIYDRIKYLKKGCDMYINEKLIILDDDLINQLKK